MPLRNVVAQFIGPFLPDPPKAEATTYLLALGYHRKTAMFDLVKRVAG